MIHQASNYHCILVAAGNGQRMGISQPKQYLSIAGRTLLEWSAQPFLDHPDIKRVVVVLSQDDHRFQQLPIANHPKIITALGGQQRYLSVLSGLNVLTNEVQPSDWVLVHDAARPNITAGDVQYLMATVGSHSVGGILGTPVTDSLKHVDADNTIQAEADRHQLWRAFTPQLFRYEILLKALKVVAQPDSLVTDEASAVAKLGCSALMVSGRSDNLKVTTLEDFELLKKLMCTEGLLSHAINREVIL